MSFDPAKLIPVAKAVRVDMALDKEARVRSALGRAYYSLFLATRAAICTAIGRHIDDGVQHGTLTDQMFDAAEETGSADISATAQVLTVLYSARQKADYKLSPSPEWTTKLAKPEYAKQLTDQAADAIRRLPTIDFTSMKGRI